MLLDTRYLFCRLLRTLEIETVCDIGSMDGSDATLFRRALPAANILAFEANPRNFALMHADERLRSRAIRVIPLAASEEDSSAFFFVVAANDSMAGARYRRGVSSLYRRSGFDPDEVVAVRTIRLDNYLIARMLAGTSIALWIDTEGTAFEVIRGSEGILGDVRLVHVEVETEPFIASAQKLSPDVDRLLRAAGFVRLATDQPPDVLQFNALYVRADALQAKQRQIRRYARRARLRRFLRRAAVRALPQRLGLRWGLVLAETRCR